MIPKSRFTILAFTSLLCCLTSSGAVEDPDVDAIMDQVVDKVHKAQAAQKDVNRIPRNVPTGRKSWETVAYDSWVSGFWPGVLWYIYDYTGDDEWRDIAHERNLPVAKILTGDRKSVV